jgi:hypothetical protein
MKITWSVADIKSVYGVGQTQVSSKPAQGAQQTQANKGYKVTWSMEDIKDVYGNEKTYKPPSAAAYSSKGERVAWSVEDIKDVYG